MTVTIHIIYCAAEGNKEKYEELKSALEKKYGDKVTVVGEEAPEDTGKFEVEMLNGDKEVLHSKEKDGYVDTDDKMKKIFDAVDKKVEACGGGCSKAKEAAEAGGG